MSDEFVEHAKSKDESSVWRFFFTNKDRNKGQCQQCFRIIKVNGSSTSGLHNHMKNIHKINTMKRHLDDASPSSSTTKITDFYERSENESLEEVISRMAALDGIPFQLFCTSEDIRKGLIARGFRDVPKSPNTIRRYVLDFAERIRNKTISQFNQLKADGNKFSISSDEWTSLRNRRFINVNVHSTNETFNLGLGRAYGKLPAEKIVQLIERRLEDFQLVPESDIVNMTTDGAKVMVKVGKLFLSEHQLCIVHGFQLAVIEVLYKKQPKQDSGEHFDGNDLETISDFLEEDELHPFIVEIDEVIEPNELIDDFNIFPLIQKIRSVVVTFRRSPTKNDEILQKYVIEEFGKDYTLILDCKTRWSSLFLMLERFFKLKSCVMKALIDVKSKVIFSDEEMEMVRTLIEILLPVKVEALCREDATLLTANTTLKFMLDNIGDGTVLHDKMKAALKRRISQRLTDLSNVLKYLHNGTYADESLGLRKLTKEHLVKMIIKFSHSEDEEENPVQSDVNKEVDIITPAVNGPLTMKEQLQQALDDAATGLTKKSEIKRDFKKVIKRELAVFEDGGGRGPNLEAVYNFLLTIKPTSVDSERAFSNAGLICTKVRSRLSDASINALAFLRSYFQKIRTITRKNAIDKKIK